MKENLMKEFALATIDKVQEMKEAAKKAGLYLSVDVNLATESQYVSIFELDANGEIKTPSIFFRPGYFMDKPGCKKFASHLQEAADLIANYNKENREHLEKEVADLAEQLKNKRAALRKAKKGGAK